METLLIALLAVAVVALGFAVYVLWRSSSRPLTPAPLPAPTVPDVAALEAARGASVLAAEVGRLTTLVQQLGVDTAQRFGQVDRSLHHHATATQQLAATANGLHQALASSNARGQWGERMADDVLRLAGLHEGVNYTKRTGLAGEGTGIPDFTFLLPRGQVLFMDVKFPMAAYLRYLDATTDTERATERAAFIRDVRARVRELAVRDYSRTDDRPAVDDVLLFVPNESLAGFIHEADPALIDEAMRQHIVLCSPLTLYAFLGVIRQAHDNYIVEQTSREILGLLGSFNQQWGRYSEAVDKVKRQFDTVSRSFDELATTRRRALDRPLRQIEQLRAQQGVAVALDGALDAGRDAGRDGALDGALDAGRDVGREADHDVDQGGDAWPSPDTVTDTGALPAGGA